LVFRSSVDILVKAYSALGRMSRGIGGGALVEILDQHHLVAGLFGLRAENPLGIGRQSQPTLTPEVKGFLKLGDSLDLFSRQVQISSNPPSEALRRYQPNWISLNRIWILNAKLLRASGWLTSLRRAHDAERCHGDTAHSAAILRTLPSGRSLDFPVFWLPVSFLEAGAEPNGVPRSGQSAM